jgi:hypothetical protein
MRRPGAAVDRGLLVAPLAALVSLAAFLHYLGRGDLLLSGDATAHINIARRVFDSRTPGPLELGTVWLPLPHLLMLPFLVSRWMWQTGVGGSIPSLVAYVFSVSGIYCLLRIVLPSFGREGWGGGFAAALAAAILGCNPNLLYLASTAMTEALYLALFIWAVLFFWRSLELAEKGDGRANTALLKSGLCVLGASLTRYDGWFLGAVLSFAAWVVQRRQKLPGFRLKVLRLALLALAAPLFWVGYNALVYGNPLEFSNGPYSAKAIEERSMLAGVPPHPGTNDLWTAFHYFFKAAQLNLARDRSQNLWVAALLVGTAVVVLSRRKLWPLILLWTPVPFYTFSIAYGSVPLYVPVWWPFSRYNLRYGIELLPAFAVFTALAADGAMRLASTAKVRLSIAALFFLFVAASYGEIWRAGPESFKEAELNEATRIQLESQLAEELQKLPQGATFLMYLGEHVGSFERAGIPLARVIHEGNHRTWKRPSDPDGLWERALAHPSSYADYVIAFDSDPVAGSVNKSELAALEILHVRGQAEATIYRTRQTPGNQAR